MELSNARVLLTGASGGIGAAIAEALARQGAQLILVGRNASSLENLSQYLKKTYGAACETVQADISTAEGRAAVLTHCSNNGGLQVLINNAGTSQFALFEDQSDHDIEQMIGTNLLAPILLTKALMPLLLGQREGTLINVGSTFGSIGYPAFTSYCASKFGLRGFTEALRREFADCALKFYYLAPRATRTKLNSDAVNALNKALGNQSDEPSVVAEQVIRLLEKGGKPVTYIGFPEKLFARINQIISGPVDGALRKQLATIKRFAKPS